MESNREAVAKLEAEPQPSVPQRAREGTKTGKEAIVTFGLDFYICAISAVPLKVE